MQPFPIEVFANIVYFSDVQTSIAFSQTSKIGRQCSSDSLNFQFHNLIDYGQNIYLNEPLPCSLGKKIFYKWKRVKSFLDSNPDKSLILVKIKKIFDLLKMFYEVIDKDKQIQVLRLPIPSFIKEMLSKDFDHDAWMEQNFHQKKIYSLIKEFKKVNLFERRYFKDDSTINKLGLSKYSGASFFLDGSNCWNIALKIQVITHYANVTFDCNLELSDQINTKWINVKKFYGVGFSHPLQLSNFIPIHDLKLKRKHYDAIRVEISELTVFEKENVQKKMEEFKPLQYCVRFSRTQYDEYGNEELVLSRKKASGELLSYILKSASNFQNINEFRQYLDKKLERIEDKEKLQYATTTISEPK